MKKYLLGIFALVLAVGMSAFTAPKTTASMDEYDWVSASNPSNTFTGTRAEAILHFGCNTGQILCAAAYEEGTDNRVPEQDLKKN
jgi:hypothetical protein